MLCYYFTFNFNSNFLCHPCLIRQVNLRGSTDSWREGFVTILSPLRGLILITNHNSEIYFTIIFNSHFLCHPYGVQPILGRGFCYHSVTSTRFDFTSESQFGDLFYYHLKFPYFVSPLQGSSDSWREVVVKNMKPLCGFSLSVK